MISRLLRKLINKPPAGRAPKKYKGKTKGGDKGQKERKRDKFAASGRGLTVRDKGAARAPDTVPMGAAIAAIVRNEASYIREWIEFHLLVGISRFYIYDNGSDDGLMSVLEPYVAAGNVRVIPWEGFVHQRSVQQLAYAHAVANVAGDIGWLAFLDVDEFLFSPTGASVVEVLKSQPPHAALAIARVEFGPGEHIRRPEGLVIDNYRLRSVRFDSEVKSIVRPWAVTAVGPHYCECEGPYVRPDPAVLRLNHYFTKSRDEFEAKVRRGISWRSDVAALKQFRSLHFFSETVPDEAILVFLDELNRRLGR